MAHLWKICSLDPSGIDVTERLPLLLQICQGSLQEDAPDGKLYMGVHSKRLIRTQLSQSALQGLQLADQHG